MKIVLLTATCFILGCSPVPIKYPCKGIAIDGRPDSDILKYYNSWGIVNGYCPAHTPLNQIINYQGGKLELFMFTDKEYPRIFMVALDSEGKEMKIQGNATEINKLIRGGPGTVEELRKYSHVGIINPSVEAFLIEIHRPDGGVVDTLELDFHEINCTCITFDSI